jgi:hypothetical protein
MTSMRLTIADAYTDQYSSIGSSLTVAGPCVMISAAGDTRHWTPLFEAMNLSSVCRLSNSTECPFCKPSPF